jgi:ketol-acid reductoisomerase
MGTDEEGKKGSVAVVGFGEQRGVGSIATKELRSAGLEIKVAGDQLLQKPLEVELGEGIDVVGCVEQACSGCRGVVFLGSTRVQPESLQDIARCMKERRVLSLRSDLDGVKMKQMGFEVL